MDYMPFVWLAVMVVAIFVESQTSSLVAIWFMPAALLTIPFTFFLSVAWQIVIFLVLSAIFIVISRFVFKKTKFIKNTATNTNALIGQSAIVTEAVRNLENVGLAKIQGQLWSAKSADGSDIEVGMVAEIIAIEGVKLVLQIK